MEPIHSKIKLKFQTCSQPSTSSHGKYSTIESLPAMKDKIIRSTSLYSTVDCLRGYCFRACTYLLHILNLHLAITIKSRNIAEKILSFLYSTIALVILIFPHNSARRNAQEINQIRFNGVAQMVILYNGSFRIIHSPLRITYTYNVPTFTSRRASNG